MEKIKNDPNIPVGTIVTLNMFMFRKWKGGITTVVRNEGNEIDFQEEDGEFITIKKTYPSYTIEDKVIPEYRIENSTHTIFSYRN